MTIPLKPEKVTNHKGSKQTMVIQSVDSAQKYQKIANRQAESNLPQAKDSALVNYRKASRFLEGMAQEP